MKNPSRPIKVLLADAHPLFRLGVITLLHRLEYPKVLVIGEAANGDQLVAETARLQPDLVLLETQLPLLPGPEAARQIHRLLPRTRIIALSAAADARSIAEMIRAGAAGYLVKTLQADELAEALRQVMNGQRYFSRDAAAGVRNMVVDTQPAPEPALSLRVNAPALTKRELEILHFVAEEKSNQEIARLLYLSPRTVETHKRNMLLKLKMKNVAGLVKYYLQTVQRDATAGWR